MKQFLFLLALLVFTACQTETPKEEVPGKATLTGKITNAETGKIKVSAVDEKFEAEVNENGEFSMDIKLEEAGHYRLSYGGENAPLFLEPGDAINLSLDTEQFDESLTFTGTGSEENNYLIEQYLLNETGMGDQKEFYAKDEADFISSTKVMYTLKKQHLEDFVKKHPSINNDFAKTAETDVLYDWAILRQKYEDYHRHYADDKEFNTSETYNDYLTTIDVNNGDLLNSEKYKRFLKSYYGNKATAAMETDESLKNDEKTGRLKAIFASISDKSPSIKEYLMYTTLKDQINYYSIDGIESFMNKFNTISTDAKHKENLKEAYDKWASLATGKLAPGFAYNNVNGEKIALSDLKGKSVYIDVWATWCGPCMRELPHLEELQEEYKDNSNIVFASVSIDENKEAWEKMVKEKEMKGVQLLADNAWDSGICKDYLIKGIPRFILVNKDGNILDSRAPRPSSDEIKTILKKLAEPVLTSMK